MMSDEQGISHPRASERMKPFADEMWRDWAMPIATLVFQTSPFASEPGIFGVFW